MISWKKVGKDKPPLNEFILYCPGVKSYLTQSQKRSYINWFKARIFPISGSDDYVVTYRNINGDEIEKKVLANHYWAKVNLPKDNM